MKTEKEFRRVFLIAGSEPLGSAGLQADIKAISACGAFAASAVTTIVNEDTRSVKGIFTIPEEMVSGQSHSYLADVKAHCIKTGMLFSRNLISCVADILKKYPDVPKVIDPVMVDSNGVRLIEEDAIEAYKQLLFPMAEIITPNAREAKLLLGHEISDETLLCDLKELSRWGNKLIVKSVQKDGKLFDYYYDPKVGKAKAYMKQKVDTHNVNGSGDSFASAIAAFIARGYRVKDAIARAEEFIRGAITEGAGYSFGSGFGPVCQFYSSVIDNEREDIAYKCGLLGENVREEDFLKEQKRLCRAVLDHPEVMKAEVILGYEPQKGQISLVEALDELAKVKQVVIPHETDKGICLVSYNDHSKPFNEYHKIEVALIPMDVADREGHWHRSNRAEYEKLFFAMTRAYKIGVVPSYRLVRQLPFKRKETPLDEVMQ